MTGITIINDGHGHPVFAVTEPLPGRKRPILCKQVGERWEVIARFENEEAADVFIELVPLLWRDRLIYKHG